jgi:uncharacterized protein HemX
MATTKKKPVTKATATRKPAAKTTPKAAPKTARKSTAKKQKAVAVQSFRPSYESTPFMTFKFTTQSIYWLILSGLVLALGGWVMYLNVQIQEIYDQVELNTQLNENYIVPTIEKAHPEAGVPQR